MKNSRKVWAILGVILLLAAALLPMVFAFGSSEESQALFRGAVGIAIMVPVFAYLFLMLCRVFGNKEKKASGEIENIIFDVGNVLVDFDWKKYLGSFGYSEEKFRKIADATFRNPVWNERDRGTLTEEEYVSQCVVAAPEYEAEIREVMKHTPDSVAQMDYAQTWVKYLKDQGYHVYILSNYGHYMLETNMPQMKFLQDVDAAVFSCEVGMIKPEAGIYQYLLDRYHLKPASSVFIDDREDNCEAARKLGIHAIRFENLKQAAAQLEKLGVK